MTNSNTLLPTSAQPDAEGFRRYRIAPSGIGSAGQSNSVTSEYGSDSNTIFDDDRLPGSNLVRPITVAASSISTCSGATTTSCLTVCAAR